MKNPSTQLLKALEKSQNCTAYLYLSHLLHFEEMKKNLQQFLQKKSWSFKTKHLLCIIQIHPLETQKIRMFRKMIRSKLRLIRTRLKSSIQKRSPNHLIKSNQRALGETKRRKDKRKRMPMSIHSIKIRSMNSCKIFLDKIMFKQLLQGKPNENRIDLNKSFNRRKVINH